MQIKDKTVTVIHLYNNFSGSPKIARQFINGVSNGCGEVMVISSFNNRGFLSGLKGVLKINVNYIFSKFLTIRLYYFLKFQFLSAINIVRIKQKDVILINTIQPFLPAILARLLGYKVIYYLHETFPKLSWGNVFLFYIMKRVSHKIICVSNFVFDTLDPELKARATIIHNPIEINLQNSSLVKDLSVSINPRKILMVSSLKKYKGVEEFCRLAELLQGYQFTLVCSASIEEVNILIGNYLELDNLVVVINEGVADDYYARHDLLLNLSRIDMVFESFGLTVLEAMSWGLPVIVPSMGGIIELVDDGVNGFRVDSRDMSELVKKIEAIFYNDYTYNLMCQNALEKARLYNVEDYNNKIRAVLCDL